MEKVIYTHKCQNSMVESIKPRGKDYNITKISAATSGQLYNSAIKNLNSFPFHIPDFLSDDDDEE